MKLEKEAGHNCLTWSGLTIGKVDAILRALHYAKAQDVLGPVGDDVFVFLDHADQAGGLGGLDTSGPAWAFRG